MAHTELDVEYVARLARLRLTNAEAKLFQEQLGEVVRHVDKLREVDLSDAEMQKDRASTDNVLRADEVRASLSQEEALRNAPRQSNELFLVTKVME